jgi:hypothetical protein
MNVWAMVVIIFTGGFNVTSSQGTTEFSSEQLCLDARTAILNDYSLTIVKHERVIIKCVDTGRPVK